MAQATADEYLRGVTEEHRNCDKHGEYTSQVYRSFGFPQWSSCPLCVIENNLIKHEEWLRREHLRWQVNALEESGIPARYHGKTLTDFVPRSEKQRVALDVAREYLDTFDQQLKAGRCLIFCGNVGTGKTHITCAIARALVLAARSVRYATVAGLIQLLRSTWRKGSEQSEMDLLRDLQSLELLVLDEIGVQYGTEAETVQLFEVLNRRYNAVRPTIVISNLDLEGLKVYLSERAVDRLRENGGRLLVFDGESHRGQAPMEVPKKALRCPEDDDSRLSKPKVIALPGGGAHSAIDD